LRGAVLMIVPTSARSRPTIVSPMRRSGVTGGDPYAVDRARRRDARQGDGATALHWAVHWDDVRIGGGKLIEADARRECRERLRCHACRSPARTANAAIAERLLRAGANPNTARSTANPRS